MQQKKAAEWMPLLQLCFQEKAICCPYDNQPNGFSSSPPLPEPPLPLFPLLLLPSV